MEEAQTWFSRARLGTIWKNHSHHTVDGRDSANHLISMKAYEKWNILHINWCRISFINSSTPPKKKPTGNPKFKVWKMMFLFKGLIFRFHVSFRGSTFAFVAIAVAVTQSHAIQSDAQQIRK